MAHEVLAEKKEPNRHRKRAICVRAQWHRPNRLVASAFFRRVEAAHLQRGTWRRRRISLVVQISSPDPVPGYKVQPSDFNHKNPLVTLPSISHLSIVTSRREYTVLAPEDWRILKSSVMYWSSGMSTNAWLPQLLAKDLSVWPNQSQVLFLYPVIMLLFSLNFPTCLNCNVKLHNCPSEPIQCSTFLLLRGSYIACG